MFTALKETLKCRSLLKLKFHPELHISFSRNTFHSTMKDNAFDQVVNDVERKLFDGEEVQRFISSVFIQPSMEIVRHKTTIEIRHQPFKKMIYKNGFEAFRRFEAFPQPFIEVPLSDDENNNSARTIIYETSIYIEM